MPQKRSIELLVKKHSGTISLAEQRELMQLLKNEKANETLFNTIDDFFEKPLSFEHAVSSEKTEQALNNLRKQITTGKEQQAPVRPMRLLKLMVAAAVLAIVAGLGWLFLYQTNNASIEQSVVVTKKGSKSNIILPDGTQVWINADTRLTYDKSFGENTREVNLEGEAFFDVVKDKNRPFIVHTQTMDVRVVGTAFNVRAYNNEASTQTTLVRGLVEVMLKKETKKKIVLKPNEKIIVQNDYQQTKTHKIAKTEIPEISLEVLKSTLKDSAIAETQWVSNRIAFDQEKLEDIIPVLERWYNVKINVKNISAPNRRYSGTFNNENLKDILESLKLAGSFNYAIAKNEVTIY